MPATNFGWYLRRLWRFTKICANIVPIDVLSMLKKKRCWSYLDKSPYICVDNFGKQQIINSSCSSSLKCPYIYFRQKNRYCTYLLTNTSQARQHKNGNPSTSNLCPILEGYKRYDKKVNTIRFSLTKLMHQNNRHLGTDIFLQRCRKIAGIGGAEFAIYAHRGQSIIEYIGHSFLQGYYGSPGGRAPGSSGNLR